MFILFLFFAELFLLSIKIILHGDFYLTTTYSCVNYKEHDCVARSWNILFFIFYLSMLIEFVNVSSEEGKKKKKILFRLIRYKSVFISSSLIYNVTFHLFLFFILLSYVHAPFSIIITAKLFGKYYVQQRTKKLIGLRK